MRDRKTEARNLVFFYVIAFGFSWALWIPQAFVAQGLLSPSFFTTLTIAAFGPLVASFLLTFLNEGRIGVLKLLKKAVHFRFKKIWLIPTFFLLPAVIGGSLLLAVKIEGVTPDLSLLYAPPMVVITFIAIFFLGGPVEEEFGWRGYALPRLQANYSALTSSVIVGFMWGVWHLPLFYISDGPYYQSPILAVIGSTILLSILFTWLFNNTGGSILIVLFFHTMYNFSQTIFPTLGTVNGGLFFMIFLAAAVAVVLVVWGPKKLVRASGD